MNAKRLFEDDDFLFDDASSDRDSHIELRIDGADRRSTMRDLASALSGFEGIPRLALLPREIAQLPLGHREGFLLSLVDGLTSIETILDVCAMPADEALAILESLVRRGILVIQD